MGACAAEHTWGGAAQPMEGRSRPFPRRPFLGRAQVQPGLEGCAAGAGGAGAPGALPRREEPGDREGCLPGSGESGAGVQRMEE